MRIMGTVGQEEDFWLLSTRTHPCPQVFHVVVWSVANLWVKGSIHHSWVFPNKNISSCSSFGRQYLLGRLSQDVRMAWPWHSSAEEGPLLLDKGLEKVTEEPEAAVSESRTQSDSDAQGCLFTAKPLLLFYGLGNWSCDEETDHIHSHPIGVHTKLSGQVKCQRFTFGRFKTMWNNRLPSEKKNLNKPMESLESFQVCSKWISAPASVFQWLVSACVPNGLGFNSQCRFNPQSWSKW